MNPINLCLLVQVTKYFILALVYYTEKHTGRHFGLDLARWTDKILEIFIVQLLDLETNVTLIIQQLFLSNVFFK